LLGAEEDSDGTDYVHAESGSCGACLVIIKDDTTLSLGGEGDCFGLACSEDEAECHRKSRIGDGFGREPMRCAAEFLDHRWRCKNGAEQTRKQIKPCDPLQPDQGTRVADDDLAQERISFSSSSAG
jgi:hypothetical protein